MKKLSYLSILALLLFSGCNLFSNKEISSLSIVRTEGSVSPSYYSEESLDVEPDYENRVLAVDYGIVYPQRDEQTLEDDFSAEGNVGGEFFDRFEDIVAAYYDGAIEKMHTELEGNKCVGGGALILKFAETGSKKKEIELMGYCVPKEGEYENYDRIDTFYRDIKNLLSEEVQI